MFSLQIKFINLILFVVIVNLTSYTAAKTFSCTSEYTSRKYGYSCQSTDLMILSEDDRTIEFVFSKTHMFDKVKQVIFERSTIHYIPLGLNYVFENMDTLDISYAQLKTISKEDLEQFGQNLRVLWLNFNELEKLNADLFIYTPNIEELMLTNNKIRAIESGSLDNLNRLKTLHIQGNPCTTSYDEIDDDRDEVKASVQRIKNSCA